MDAIILQICLAGAMFLTTALAGLIPLKLIRLLNRNSEESHRASWIMTILSCFGGGVFIGTCFLDIFPHVKENFEKFKHVSDWHTSFPVPEFMACIGFFLVYFLEEISLKIFSTSDHPGHSHGGGGNNLNTNNVEENSRPRAISDTDATTTFVNGNPRMSIDSNSPDKYIAAKTHEIVIDESVRYVVGESKDGGVLKSITFAIAMSLHSLLEGFALGVQDNSTGILTLFFSLIIHKGIEAFSVGLQITRVNSNKTCLVISTILVYALMTPVGSMLGVALYNIDMNPVVKEGTVVVLEGLAGGTFIYVTFFEILATERANDHSNLIQLLAIFTGFAVIFGLQLKEHASGGGHGHSHGH
uniref:Uncharacterized protein n=1 Tax=Panagrolaimus sp. ES5 TaxID=591445 RepID=A0AC34GN76_9BILA